MNEVSDAEILKCVRIAKARGVEPWWQRRRAYLWRAGRRRLIAREGLVALQKRAKQLQRARD